MTEPKYFHGLQKHYEFTVQLLAHPERGVPRTLLSLAKEARAVATTLAKRENDPFLDYDAVWLVFDRDEHLEFESVIKEADDADIEVAVSNPCFELWLYLHFREQPGMRHRHDMQSLMSGCVNDYDKQVDFAQYALGVEEATRRAKRLDEDARSRDEPYSNPSTTVYRVIERYQKCGEQSGLGD